MPYNLKEDSIRKGNHWSIGDIGENWVKYKLSQKRIDSLIIDRTYDIFAWQRGHRIEVKAAHIRKDRDQYHFNFKFWQTVEDAFDYAVCCCLDDKNKIVDAYIIPHTYIHQKADKCKENFKIFISKNNKDSKFQLVGNSYDKFAVCRYPNLDFDIFAQNNKRAFTRKKNKITKQLNDYSINHEKAVLKAFEEVFNDKSIKYPTKTLREEYGFSSDFIVRVRRKLGIRGRYSKPVKYVCKCGYTTRDKGKYKRHLNRKTPCIKN